MKIARLMNKEDLIVFNEQPSPQQVRVVGNPFRLNHEVGFQPQYTIDAALEEILDINGGN